MHILLYATEGKKATMKTNSNDKHHESGKKIGHCNLLPGVESAISVT